MPSVKFNQSDLMGSKPLSPGWRTLQVESISEGPGKTDPSSIVYPCFFVVVEGPDQHARARKYFTEKRMEDFAKFLRCFMKGGELASDQDVDYTKVAGRYVQGFVQFNSEMNWNEVTHFKASDKLS